MPATTSTLRLTVFNDPAHGLLGLIVDDRGVVVLGHEAAISCVLSAPEPADPADDGATVLDGDGCRLTLEPAAGPPTPAPAGGEQHPLTVRGTVSHDGATLELDARGTALTLPLPKAFGSARLAAAWPDPDRVFVLGATRPAGADGHDRDLVSAWVQDGSESTAVADPRLSVTTLPGEVPLRVGLELWLEDDEGNYDYPRRATGEVLSAGAELSAAGLTVDAHSVAFGTGESREPGLYAVLRPV